MSIKHIIIKDFIQDFTVSKEDKLHFGEIYSPFSLIQNMFNLFNPEVFSNKHAKWLDTGAGTGYFSMILFDLLNKGLATIIFNEEERKTHIIENMIYLIELKTSNLTILRDRFGPKANIIGMDFLSYNTTINFDYIIGNPPYNANGLKKVPTNTKTKKKEDGRTVWMHFIKKSLLLLKADIGQLCYIVPSLWMKPDKAGLYNLLTKYKIEKLNCLTNTATNKLFKGEAQTPTCYFLLTNTITSTTSTTTNMHTIHTHTINIFDKICNKYIDYTFSLGLSLPLFAQSIIQKLQPFITKAGGPIKVIKTNMPGKNSLISNTYDSIHFPYANITTCLLNGLQPELAINYSSSPQVYANQTKLVLAHKMYGFPYLDKEGKYGISNRDNYVILLKPGEKTLADLEKLQDFLSTKFVLYIYEAARYRMKYLEKYAFEFLPDLTKLPDFPTSLHGPTSVNYENNVATYFGLNDEEKQHILDFGKKYDRF
jgi:hypothetical protein